MDLNNYRKQIDAIDDKLLRLFKERMDIARQIALYKNEQGLPLLDVARERAKLSDISEKAGEEICAYANKLYTTLFELSRAYQEQSVVAKKE